MDVLMAKSTTIKTSLTRVTPRTVLVKGPRARISLMMAMAEEGERAANIVPPSSAAAKRPLESSSRMKGI